MERVRRGLKPQRDELAAIDRWPGEKRKRLNHAEAGETRGEVGVALVDPDGRAGALQADLRRTPRRREREDQVAAGGARHARGGARLHEGLTMERLIHQVGGTLSYAVLALLAAGASVATRSPCGLEHTRRPRPPRL